MPSPSRQRRLRAAFSFGTSLRGLHKDQIYPGAFALRVHHCLEFFASPYMSKEGIRGLNAVRRDVHQRAVVHFDHGVRCKANKAERQIVEVQEPDYALVSWIEAHPLFAVRKAVMGLRAPSANCCLGLPGEENLWSSRE